MSSMCAVACVLCCVLSRFATIHPLVEGGGDLPSRLQDMATLVRGVTGTNPCHIIAQLQGPDRIMNLHSDLDSRGYVANCVGRWATDGSAGTVDFCHDADKLTVYRIHMKKPTIHLMDPRGGGLTATDPGVDPRRWAHGVTTCGLEAFHFWSHWCLSTVA